MADECVDMVSSSEIVLEFVVVSCVVAVRAVERVRESEVRWVDGS